MTIPFPFGRRLELSAHLIRTTPAVSAPVFGPEWDDRALIRLATLHNAGISAPWERAVVLLDGHRRLI